MYTNIGRKIKTIAAVLGWLCLISGAIAWLILITNGYDSWSGYKYITEDDYIGWIALLSGILGYISSWFTYGFGQLVEDVHILRRQSSDPDTQRDELPKL